MSVRLVLQNSITSRVLRQADAVAESLGAGVYGDLSEYELAAVQYTYGKGRVTVRGLAEHLGRSSKVARATLRSLADKRILDWHGTSATDPSQYYDLHRAE